MSVCVCGVCESLIHLRPLGHFLGVVVWCGHDAGIAVNMAV